jgi:hypothetical protein
LFFGLQWNFGAGDALKPLNACKVDLASKFFPLLSLILA